MTKGTSTLTLIFAVKQMPSSVSLQLDTFLGSWVAICYHCMQTTCPQQCLSRLEDIIGFVLFYNTMVILILFFGAASPVFYTKSTVHVVCWWEKPSPRLLSSWEGVSQHLLSTGDNHNYQACSCFPVSRGSTSPAKIVLKSKKKAISTEGSQAEEGNMVE